MIKGYFNNISLLQLIRIPIVSVWGFQGKTFQGRLFSISSFFNIRQDCKLFLLKNNASIGGESQQYLEIIQSMFMGENSCIPPISRPQGILDCLIHLNLRQSAGISHTPGTMRRDNQVFIIFFIGCHFLTQLKHKKVLAGDLDGKKALESFKTIYCINSIPFSLGKILSDNMLAGSAHKRNGDGCVSKNTKRRFLIKSQELNQINSQT